MTVAILGALGLYVQKKPSDSLNGSTNKSGNDYDYKKHHETFKRFELNEDEYSDIIGQQREKEGGFKAALKDPKDGKVYTGKTHANVYWEAPEDVRKRFTEYLDHKNRNFSRASIAGFVNSDGLWHTRKDMERLYGGDHAEKLMAAGRIQ